jgi:hypothetical protein
MKRTRKFWTDRDHTYLVEQYPNRVTLDIAKELGRSEKSLYSRANEYGLKKSPEFLKSENSGRANVLKQSGVSFRFKKGQVPPNKGKKWSEFMSTEGMSNSKKTTFKKGTVPPNYKPVGSERIDKDGYLMVKVREGLRGWDLKHRHVYRLNFGEIPKGYNVEFIDRNKLNCEPSNLVLRTRVENMKINTYHNYPKEIATTIQLMGALQRQINKHAKK